MNSLKMSASSFILPADLMAALGEKITSGWTGTIGLNFKEGEIVAFEITEKKRVARETHVRPLKEENVHG